MSKQKKNPQTQTLPSLEEQYSTLAAKVLRRWHIPGSSRGCILIWKFWKRRGGFFGTGTISTACWKKVNILKCMQEQAKAETRKIQLHLFVLGWGSFGVHTHTHTHSAECARPYGKAPAECFYHVAKKTLGWIILEVNMFPPSVPYKKKHTSGCSGDLIIATSSIPLQNTSLASAPGNLTGAASQSEESSPVL